MIKKGNYMRRYGIALILLLMLTGTASAAWWNSSWNYRTDNVISNGTRLYQIELNISNASGTNNATHVFFNGHANTNYTDVRVTLDNSTMLPYWISVNANKLYVNVTGNGTVNIYYGNTGATATTGNGDATFLFFDDFQPTSWTRLNNTPINIADQASVTINNDIYLIGGYFNGGDVNRSNQTWVYNVTTDTYSRKADLKQAKWGLWCIDWVNATNSQQEIYCFGGSTGSGTERYNVSNNSWLLLNNPPAAMQNQGHFGDKNETGIFDYYGQNMYFYTPGADTWTLLNNTPPHDIRNWGQMVYRNNKLYIFGGYGQASQIGETSVMVFNLTTNAYDADVASMPVGLYGHMRENTTIGDKNYILQGQRYSGEFFSRFWVYNFTANSWSWGRLSYWDADGVSGGRIGNKIYTFAGRRDTAGPNGTNFVQVLDVTSSDAPARWQDNTVDTWRINTSLPGGILELGNFQHVTLTNVAQIKTVNDVIFNNEKVISRISYSSSGSGGIYGGLMLQSNGGLYYNTDNSYLSPYIDVGGGKDWVIRETGASFPNSNSAAPQASVNDWHMFSSSFDSTTVTQNRDYGNMILSLGDNTYRSGKIQVFRTVTGTNGQFNIQVDYVAVSNYSSPEPGWVSWLSEQQQPQSNTYSVSGYVNDTLGAAISSASVVNGTNSTTTDAAGYYSLTMGNGTYNFSYSKSGYITGYREITINGVNLTNQNVTLTSDHLPNITSWSNDNTSNANLTLTVEKNTNVTFNIIINQSVTTTWAGSASPTKINGTNESISYAYKNFTSAGTYTVVASCSNANGSCLNSVTWTVTVNGTGNRMLSGYVKNVLDLSLENARVDFNGSHVFTNANGYYSFTGISDGNYVTLVRAIGYVDSTNTSTINADTVMNFTLVERTTDDSGSAIGLILVVLVLLKLRK